MQETLKRRLTVDVSPFPRRRVSLFPASDAVYMMNAAHNVIWETAPIILPQCVVSVPPVAPAQEGLDELLHRVLQVDRPPRPRSAGTLASAALVRNGSVWLFVTGILVAIWGAMRVMGWP